MDWRTKSEPSGLTGLELNQVRLPDQPLNNQNDPNHRYRKRALLCARAAIASAFAAGFMLGYLAYCAISVRMRRSNEVLCYFGDGLHPNFVDHRLLGRLITGDRLLMRERETS